MLHNTYNSDWSLINLSFVTCYVHEAGQITHIKTSLLGLVIQQVPSFRAYTTSETSASENIGSCTTMHNHSHHLMHGKQYIYTECDNLSKIFSYSATMTIRHPVTVREVWYGILEFNVPLNTV